MDSYLERLRQELEEATDGVSAESLAQAPPGKWNAAQILEHLLLTYKGTNAGLAKCCEQGTPLGTRATWKDHIGRTLVVDLGYMPGGRAAPERTKPRGMAVDGVRSATLVELEKMRASLDDCERRFGARAKILDHLIFGPLTAGQWRKFHWVHGRHHLRQVRERVGKA
jgi:DinB superfamily